MYDIGIDTLLLLPYLPGFSWAQWETTLGLGLMGDYGIPGCIAMDKFTSCLTLRYWHIYMSRLLWWYGARSKG